MIHSLSRSRCWRKRKLSLAYFDDEITPKVFADVFGKAWGDVWENLAGYLEMWFAVLEVKNRAINNENLFTSMSKTKFGGRWYSPCPPLKAAPRNSSGINFHTN